MEGKKLQLFYDGVIIVETPHDRYSDKVNIVIKEEGINGLYYVDTFDEWKDEKELKFMADMIRFKIPVEKGSD